MQEMFSDAHNAIEQAARDKLGLGPNDPLPPSTIDQIRQQMMADRRKRENRKAFDARKGATRASHNIGGVGVGGL